MTPPAAGNPDALTVDQFEAELLRFTHSRPFTPVPDPLEHVLKRVEASPASPGSRLLARLLAALAGQSGCFRYAEVGALDTESIANVVQLMRARRTGVPAAEAWLRAASRARGYVEAT